MAAQLSVTLSAANACLLVHFKYTVLRLPLLLDCYGCTGILLLARNCCTQAAMKTLSTLPLAC